MNTFKVIKLLRNKSSWHHEKVFTCNRVVHESGIWFHTGCSCVAVRDKGGKRICDGFFGFFLRRAFSAKLERRLLCEAGEK